MSVRRKVTDYRIVSNRLMSTLEAQVEHYIELGWQPFGGVSYCAHEYTQSLVRYKYLEETNE